MGRRWWRAALVCLAMAAPAGPAHADAFDYERDFAAFVSDFVSRHDVPESEVRVVLEQASFSERVLDLMSRPAERKPWFQYRPIFLTESRIEGGLAFWRDNRPTLERAQRELGVPVEIIVAIIGVETLYGKRAGTIRVLDSLATLGFRHERRGKFFRRELGQFLLLAREEHLDPLAVQGSYAGAMGIPQFIPSSYRAYAVDFDGDGRRDLLGNVADAIGSVASYLGRHGWRQGALIAAPASVEGDGHEAFTGRGLEPDATIGDLRGAGVTVHGDGLADEMPVALHRYRLADGTSELWATLHNFYVITRYNRSRLYTMAVYQLADEIRARHGGAGG